MSWLVLCARLKDKACNYGMMELMRVEYYFCFGGLVLQCCSSFGDTERARERPVWLCLCVEESEEEENKKMRMK